MKKIFILAALLVSALAADAQAYLGGSLGFWRNSNENQTSAVILPEIGYNFNSKWAIGTQIGYMHEYDEGLKFNAFVFNPYARLTFFRQGIVSLFVDGTFELATGKAKYEDWSNNYTPWGIGFKPGIALNVSKNCSFVAHLGFLGYRDNDHLELDRLEGFGLDLSSQNLTFGFYYNF